MQPDPLSQAIEHFRSGRLEEAEERCRVVLGRDPEHAEANHLLGAMCFQRGMNEQALAFLKRAATSPRATAEMHNHLGAAFNVLGRKDEAAQAFERALAINPDLLKANPNLKSIYRGVVPGWHFQMMGDSKRNETYEAAIRRAAPGKSVLDIGTGAGLLALMAARAGAAKVTTCESVGLMAARAREIIAQNGLSDRITVIPKTSTDMAVPRDMPERAEVLVTETFASGLITEGVLPTVEHAHEHLLTPNATIIPAAACVMGYLAGGPVLQGMLFVGRIAGFDLSGFNDFAPAMLAVSLDNVPHQALSDDIELMRFNLKERRFPAGGVRLALKATHHGICAGIAQWIKLELDAHTTYENRPSPQADFNNHWTHIVHRFPRLVTVAPGDVVPILFRHDRTQIGIELLG